MDAIISEPWHQEEIAGSPQSDQDALLSAVAVDAEAFAALKAEFHASTHAGRMAFIEALLKSKNPHAGKMLSDVVVGDTAGNDPGTVPKLCALVRAELLDRMASMGRLKLLADLVAVPEKAP
jgi:hypothetical protein